MARSGLTREAKTAVVRAALIEAAAQMFAERGFDRTSLDAVADQAGLTKGAVYSNFEDKEDLFFEACRSVAAGGSQNVLVGDGSVVSRLAKWAVSVGRLSSTVGSDRRAALDAEALQLALRSERTRTWVAAQQAQARAALAWVLQMDGAATEEGVGVPPQEMATIILALLRGLLMERTIAPDAVPDHYFADAVRLLITDAGDRSGSVSGP